MRSTLDVRILPRLAVFVTAAYLFAAPAHAALVDAYQTSNVSTTYGYSGTLGFEFTPQHDITVKELGYYDNGLDGFPSGSPVVGIWDGDANLIVSAFVGSSDRLDGLYRFASIPDTVLQGGTMYVIGGRSESGPVTDTRFSTATFIPDIVPGLARWDPSSGLFFPENTAPAFVYNVPNFTIDVVPEPASLLLGGVAAAGYTLLVWKLRSAQRHA